MLDYLLDKTDLDANSYSYYPVLLRVSSGKGLLERFTPAWLLLHCGPDHCMRGRPELIPKGSTGLLLNFRNTAADHLPKQARVAPVLR